MKILIVDDNADYRLLLVEVFRDKGWETLDAPDGEACLRLLHEEVPDVILSDVMMPRMDGFQLLRALRGSPFKDLTFIFYTSTYEKPEHREFAMSLGADAYIIKPLDPEDIFAALNAVLEGKEAETGRHVVVTEEEFLRKHNIVLSDKLLEKALELQKEAAEHRRDEEELEMLRHRSRERKPGIAASGKLSPVQCPFTVSENVYIPIRLIDEICEEMSIRKDEITNSGAMTLVDQLCTSMRRLRQHIKDLQNHILIPRSELYAPMRRIQMLIEVLKKDYPDVPGWVGARIAQIEEHLRQFAVLVEDLVKLTMVAKAEVNRQPLDLTMLGRSLLEDLRKLSPQRQAEVVVRDGMEVHADRRLLRLAIEQLLDNAWKFTKTVQVARIEFNYMTSGQRHMYFIRDNGTGFAMEDADRLFTAFHKLHPMEEYPGHGIGLAMVKTIICRHGGSVWATGEPGKGATFYFTLEP